LATCFAVSTGRMSAGRRARAADGFWLAGAMWIWVIVCFGRGTSRGGGG
jgi:hypothetical protein